LLARLREPGPTDWILRAQVAQALHQPEAALEHLAHVPPEGNTGAQAAYLVGQIELQRYHARAAEDALKAGLRLDPSLSQIRRAFIYLFGIQQRREELMEQFAALAEQGPLTVDLVRDWCLSHDLIGEPSEVVKDLEQFVEADPTDKWSRLALADAYRRTGKNETAETALSDLSLDDPDVRAARAELATALGDSEAAEALLQDGPADHAVLARLRGKRALARRDGPEAVRYYRLADKARPNDRDTLIGLGLSLRLIGEEDESITRRANALQALRVLLLKASEDRPEGAPAFCKMAEACEEAGLRDEARAWYRLAVMADPLHAPAQQAFFRLSADRRDPPSPR
jgi:tetratricopeptide (TPR) repeat protein